jgi:hypothetical protein
MKNSALASAVVAVLLGTSVALAQTPADEHSGHHPEGAMPRMQDNMKKMQDLMAKIHASKDAAERKQLLQQHSKAMMEQMELMRGMGGGAGGMMGGGMKMGGGMPGGTGATPGAQGGSPMDDGMMKQMMMNHQAMQGRMDMMQMMMGQMLQNQEAQQNVKPAK